MLAECLAAVIAQQLLKTADGSGRVAAHEILLGSPALAAMIREGKTFQIPNLMQAGGAAGMQTMDAALERLVTKGTVTGEDALEKAIDKESFQKVVARRAGPPG
jgi:twitching motility protein PilT